MGFLAPFMLWGAAAASIPIALHFFFRTRYRTIPWAAMKFLLTSIEQTSRRLRFQELLLLLARVAVLVLLALALARPLSAVDSGAGKGDAVDAVFVMDTSYSMGANDGAVNRLERARTAALNVLDQLPPHSTVQVIACADRAALLGPRSPSNLENARAIIQELPLSHLASDLLPGLENAASVLERGQASNKEFYLFSDMHKLGWEQRGGEVVRLLRDIKDKSAVYLVRCGRSRPKNVAVVGISPQSGIPRPGERVGFAVLVKNTGIEAVRDLKVSLLVDDNAKTKETQSINAIGPGETRAVTLTGKLEQAGLRILTATVEHDDLEADNRFDQVILVRDRINVLVVDGAPNEKEPRKSASFYLEHALLPVNDPSKYYLNVQHISPRLASPARLAKQDLCILVDVSLKSNSERPAETLPADFVEELARFVRHGHGLMIFAGDNVAAEPYNQILGEKHQLLPLKVKGTMDFAKRPLQVDRNSVGLPTFAKFKEDKNYQGIAYLAILRSLDLEEPSTKKEKKETAPADPDAKKPDEQENVNVVLRYSNGKPMVATRKVDKGEVMFFATAAAPGWKADDPNPTWNDWPLEDFFLYTPFMDVSLNYLLHGQTQNHNLTAGQTLNWHPRDKEVRAYTLVHPGGKKERLGLPELVKDLPTVTATDLPRAGIYYLLASKPPRPDAPQEDEEPPAEAAAAKEKGLPLAVVPDLRESENLESFSNQQLDERLGFKVIHVTAGSDAATFSEVERLNREWTLWILALVLLLVLCESVLAWLCGRAW